MDSQREVLGLGQSDFIKLRDRFLMHHFNDNKRFFILYSALHEPRLYKKGTNRQ